MDGVFRAKQLRIAMRGLLVFLLLCAGCSRPPEAPVKGAENTDLMEDGPNASAVSLEELRRGAEGGRAASQRELAGRLLFGQGVPADPAAAVVWARKAALHGDETASLWTGRAVLGEPNGRLEAAAWFLICEAGTNKAISQDAAAELAALALSQEQLGLAAKRAEELKKIIRTNSKQGGDL
jgi:TPR repeat protein